MSGEKNVKKDASLLGVTASKQDSFPQWYVQVITRAELIEYYDISGCYILRPWAYSIWEHIQAFFDTRMKRLGVQNAYFPLLVTKQALEAEKDNFADFCPEVAWITKTGQSDLPEENHIAVRPTSETIMYPAYKKWIRSWRDLPLKLNQWTNVVRWEFKSAVPFLRSREFLWQEGHTAFATAKEADEEVLQILDLYAKVYEELLAIPVIKGRKSDKEKFAGADYTTTVEAFVPINGRGVQGATSHHLGRNFAKVFHIEFENEKGGRELVYQNSWGLTTRSIGVLVMIHGDSKGLVLPPRVAPQQVVIIPLHFKGKDPAEVDKKGFEICEVLQNSGIRAHVDNRTLYNPGWKYNHWEMKGVPLRIEIGPKDMEANQVVICRRDNGAKEPVPMSNLVARANEFLEDIQKSLFEKACRERDTHMVNIKSWAEFVPALDGKNMVLAPWCLEKSCEDKIKERSAAESKEQDEKSKQTADVEGVSEEQVQFKLTGAAKSLCIPFEQQALPANCACFACGAPAKKWALFGRSY